MQGTSWRHGIQVDYTYCFPRIFMEQNIVKLGIVVNHTSGKVRPVNRIRKMLIFKKRVDQWMNRGQKIDRVALNQLGKAIKPFGRVMKIRNCLNQGRQPQIV